MCSSRRREAKWPQRPVPWREEEVGIEGRSSARNSGAIHACENATETFGKVILTLRETKAGTIKLQQDKNAQGCNDKRAEKRARNNNKAKLRVFSEQAMSSSPASVFIPESAVKEAADKAETFVATSMQSKVHSEYWGATPNRTPGQLPVARREIVIRFFGCTNPENHCVSNLPAPLVGKSCPKTGI